MTDRTVSFRLLSSGAALPEPPAAVPRPDTHWRDSYFDAPSDATGPFHDLGDAAVRRELWATKALLDPIPEALYYKARNDTFPLAVGGAQGSNTFFNRAGHKLNEVMEVTGIWNNFVRSAGSVSSSSGTAAVAAAAASSNNKADAADDEAAAADGERSPSTSLTSNPLAAGDAALAPAPTPMPKKGGSNIANVRGRTAFVDLCGGPGSFAQAIFGAYPRKSKVKLVGFGLTLKDPNMADKHNTAADGWYPNLVENKNFHPTFGVNGEGDIYKMSNVHALSSVTEGFPMLLAVADGGFEVPQADANFQETISMRLAYCQWHAALCVLQPGGALVLKLFDTFSPAMRSMLFLTTKLFDSTFIVKPKHSRAVNSERYLAAKGFRGIPSHSWRLYLQRLHSSAFSDDSLPASLVPAEWMAVNGPDGGAFESSMVSMNKSIANNQIEAIKKVMAHDGIRVHLGEKVDWNEKRPGEKRGRDEADDASRAAAEAAEDGAKFATTVDASTLLSSEVPAAAEEGGADEFVVTFV